MNHPVLQTWLAASRHGPVPALEPDASTRLQREHDGLQDLLRTGAAVYGVNRQPGHRDDEAGLSGDELGAEMLRSHAIAEGPCYSPFEARCIGMAKLAMWRAGGSGVAPALHAHLTRLMADADFQPAVPRGSSYSAGDVIPGAHWARAVLQGTAATGAYAQDPQVMALINGAFVHAGVALASLRPLRNAWALFFENTVVTAGCMGNNTVLKQPAQVSAAAQQACEAWRHACRHHPAATGRQDPLSLRATDQVFETLLDSLEQMATRLEAAWQSPSCNPRIDAERRIAISQASFMLPALTAAQSAVIEALLLAMWAQVGRVTHLLGGQVAGTARDGATADHPLGWIQHPKQMMALLEEARLLAGRRAFASGGATSYGTEDLWSHGLATTETLLAVSRRFLHLGGIEAWLLHRLRESGQGPPASATGGLWADLAAAATPLAVGEALAQRLDAEPSLAPPGFPVRC